MEKPVERKEQTILIIDDQPTNLRVMAEYLEMDGFELMVAQNGEDGLAIARAGQPDIILLDVMMPGIDGFETCRRLQQDDRTRDIPIIFMTALADVDHKVKGFEAGAVDYVTKPIQQAEVLARINTHLRLRELTRQIQQSNQEIRDAFENLNATQRQLIESEKMAALGNLVAGVAHEINTPIGIGVTAASTLADETALFFKEIENGQIKRSVLEDYVNVARDSSELILRNLSRAAELVQSFKQVAVDQTNLDQRKFSLKPYLTEVIRSLGPRLKQTGHRIEIEGDDQVKLTSYPGAFSQVVTNLVMNSIKHGYPYGGHGLMRFEVYQDADRVILQYTDNGCGISPENLNKIFEPFFTTARHGEGTGLGLHITYNLVTQKLGGTIRCESQVGQYTQFTIQLPIEVRKS
ncbi:MAG: hybrid sensor histidine kinase/response regulator [Anaerolineales bacterium]|nr:hybrid sensor histidine kinase/response regulator [Anaerolineales bacterium]